MSSRGSPRTNDSENCFEDPTVKDKLVPSLSLSNQISQDGEFYLPFSSGGDGLARGFRVYVLQSQLN